MPSTTGSGPSSEMTLNQALLELEREVLKLQETIYGPTPQRAEEVSMGGNKISMARNRVIEAMSTIAGVRSTLELI